MKNILFMVMVIAGLATFASPAITDVTVQLENPWKGKVYISYKITGDIAAIANEGGLIASLKVTATDTDANKTYTAVNLSGDTSLVAGMHSCVWDLNDEGLEFMHSDVTFKVSCEITPATYCIIDLSAGASATFYPVTYLESPPIGGFNGDEYKTSKLVLRRIEPGSFIMGNDQEEGACSVVLTKPFFCGLFEVTQEQYALVTGSNPSIHVGGKRPVDNVSYEMVRGPNNGALWPLSTSVDSDSFMGRVQQRTGLAFDLPTEAQWEFACRAGTMSKYNNGGNSEVDLKMLGRYSNNTADGKGGYTSYHTIVGAYAPNEWGLYDMHGNNWELCLDWYDNLSDSMMDPVGSSLGELRIARGGCWGSGLSECTSSHRGRNRPSARNGGQGFRLFRSMDSVDIAEILCAGTSTYIINTVTNDILWLKSSEETGWFVEPREGSVMRSGAIGNSTNSWMETIIIGPLLFSFDWKVSCNIRGHYLAWLIDGVEQARIRGETDWTNVTAFVPEGEHVVRFDYVKGSTSATGEDKGQVRNFTMGLRVDTDSMRVTWDWTTNYWVECSVVGKGSTSFESQWVSAGTNLVIPFSINTPFYALSLSGDADGAVLGDDSITVPIVSPRSIVLTVIECAYNTVLNSGLLPWISGGAANWVPQREVSHDGQDAVRSGKVVGDDVSMLSTIVSGSGTLSWWWKLTMADCAGVDVFVDSVLVKSLESVSEWSAASVDIIGNGEHSIRFEFWNAGSVETINDCAYLDQVSWSGATIDHTVTTPAPIPYSYFDMSCPTLLMEHGGYYEAAAHDAASNGHNKIWECYVAGINPTNAESRFVAKINMVDGAPVVTWEPNLNTNGIIRAYKVYGKETLEGGGEWQYPTNSLHRFFKVEVGLP